MHHLIFGHSFAEIVAWILLLGLLFNFFIKMTSSGATGAKDADTGASSSSVAPTKTNNGASGSLTTPRETSFDASSSSTTPTKASFDATGNQFHVFLSFAEQDFQEDFPKDLYKRLDDVGIRFNKDDRGEELSSNLLNAINDSKILIPVLSINYGSKKRCLDELVQIMECKDKNKRQVVLPIFYKERPVYVRSSEESTIIEKREQALNKISSSKGWEAQGDEGQLVELVVRKVLIELKKVLEPVITENSVGIKSPLEKIMNFLDSRGSTLYVGIYGEGGVGKTTLAKIIYNKLFEQFDHCSFIPNVAESCKCNSIVHLRDQLILDILGEKKYEEDQSSAIISLGFRRLKVLILLDNVNANDQLKELVGDRNWFAPGSRIIITTREKSVLDWAKVDYEHEHKAMGKNEAEILFARHAFLVDSPPKEFLALSHEVISLVHGFPLTLEIIGSYLCGKSLASWEKTKQKLQESQRFRKSEESKRKLRLQWLQQLQESQRSWPLQESQRLQLLRMLQELQLLWQESPDLPRMEMQEILKIVYGGLEFEQKKIFLDIACFLVGTDARIAFCMWDTSDFNLEPGIEELIYFSLIKIGDNHELRMHDEVRDFGKSIACEGRCNEPDNGRRLWDYEEVLKMLDEKEGAEYIRGLSLDKGNPSQTFNLDGSNTSVQFKNLASLRFLSVSDANFVGEFDDIFPKLRWLRWERCPKELQAERFAAEELAVLDLSRSMISDNWNGWDIIKSEKLKVLNLTGCGSLETTFFLSNFKHLEILIFRNCSNLIRILPSIGDLEALVFLDLRGCPHLTKLPDEVGNLEGLKELFLDRTGITEIPHKIWSLARLQRFSLRRCYLTTLCGNSIVELKSLTELVLTYTGITELPDSITNMQNLGVLNIRETPIEELQDAIGSLSKLRELNASWCDKLRKIDRSIHKLSSLQSLDLRYCLELQDLPELPSNLTVVSVTCKSDRLPSFSHLNHLKQLRLYDCQALKCIPELPSTTLELEISGCKSLESLTPPEAVKDSEVSLKRLDIIRCTSLGKLDLSQLNLLRVLYAVDCTKMHEIGGLDKLDSLESLTFRGAQFIDKDKPFSIP